MSENNINEVNEAVTNAKTKRKPFKQAFEFVKNENGIRALVTVPSLFIEFFFAFFNFYIGFLSASLWHVMLSFYYLLLMFLRINVISRAGRCLISRDINKRMLKNHHKFGFSLLMLDIVMSIAMYILLRMKIGKPFNALLIVPIGIYTVYKVIVAMINLFKAHSKSKSLFVLELRKISQADALVSLLMLESALITRFGDLKDKLYFNISFYSGIAVALIIFIMAVTSLFRKKV